MDYDTFEQLCHIQSVTESFSSYQPVCQQDCLCRTFSLVNYVTYLSGKGLCHEVTQTDLKSIMGALVSCKQFYDSIPKRCWFDKARFGSYSCNVSKLCENGAFYELYHFIVSKNQRQTITFLHVAQGQQMYALYEDLLQVIQDYRNKPVKLVALNFGLKELVFEKFLLNDSFWIILALFIVIVIMWIYTESIFITFTVLSSMLFTVILSYTVYKLVFGIEYFPFLNLLATVVLVGIGADDLFIFWKTWIAIKLSRNASILERIVSHTFKHASVAMFVTSASTATAFYASTYTDIVSIRCFCIYAGTCVLMHYVLVITWLPACVVLYEKYSLNIIHTSGKGNKLLKCLDTVHSYFTKVVRTFHNRQSSVSTLSYVWLPLFLLLSIGGAMALFVWPTLSAPSSHMFQMLSAEHPFEIFERDVKNNFEFLSNHDYLPLTIMFGVDRTFNGEYFKLESTGRLILRPLPDLSVPANQRWFLNFCFELRQQPFFDRSFSQPDICFIEQLRGWMRFRSCTKDPICCKDLRFPYSSHNFSHCLHAWSLEKKEHSKSTTIDPGVRFAKTTPSAVVISFWSNVKFDYNYENMQQFHHNISTFVADQVAACPAVDCESYSPIFTASQGLLFYDIQATLLNSLPISLAVILSATCVIIFLTTLNVLLTISALLSISCSILTTLGTLALMRWELNIVESVIVSLTVGLSIDFPLHVAVAYRISSTTDRRTRVIVTLRHVGGSLTAAMATTLVAGICMLPAKILAYTKLGAFLALVIFTSWLYAMFFMPALLTHIGPIGSFLQLRLPRCRKTKRQQGRRSFEKTVYSDEMSSEVAQPVASQSSPFQLGLVMEETAEQLELNEMEATTSASSLLQSDPLDTLAYIQSYSRLSPIAELSDESYVDCV